MIHKEDPAVVEKDGFEDVEADFADPGEPGTYVLPTRRPDAGSGDS
ncbi:MAG: hypothetical protein HOZ81_04790 [Streptomyces sp.]|nr:hypothetical protein [Streptomyces sp.]